MTQNRYNPAVNPALPSGAPEILPPSSPELHEIDQNLRQGAKSYRFGLRTIMFYGWKLRLAERWQDLGFADEDAYRRELDVPQSTWYKYVGLGFELRGIPFDDLKQICITTLELMTQIQPELWRDYPWIDEAKQLKPAEFADLIVIRRKQNGDNSEPMCHVKWKVTYLSKQFLEEVVLEFQKRHNLSTPGRALELMIADIHDRPNITAIIEQAKALIVSAQYHMRAKKNFYDEETHDMLGDARNLLDAEVAKTIYEARQVERSKGRRGRNHDAGQQFSGASGTTQ